jgi:hypothetical protein
MEDQIKQTQQLVENLTAEMQILRDVRKNNADKATSLQSRRDSVANEMKQLKESIADLQTRQSGTEDIQQLASLNDSIIALTKDIGKLHTQHINIVSALIELENEEQINKTKFSSLTRQLKALREQLKALQEANKNNKQKKAEITPAVEMPEISAVSAIQGDLFGQRKVESTPTSAPVSQVSNVAMEAQGMLRGPSSKYPRFVKSKPQKSREKIERYNRLIKEMSGETSSTRDAIRKKGAKKAYEKGEDYKNQTTLFGTMPSPPTKITEEIKKAVSDPTQAEMFEDQYDIFAGQRPTVSKAATVAEDAKKTLKGDERQKEMFDYDLFGNPTVQPGKPIEPEDIRKGNPFSDVPDSKDPRQLDLFKQPPPPLLPPVKNMQALVKASRDLLKAFIDLSKEIEKTSRILSTDWTDAAKILVERIGYSISSGIQALMGRGIFARRDEIQQAQEQFGQQFGGVMSTKAATEMAGVARSLNIMPQQYIAALRPLSGILGGITQAQTRIQSTTKSFMAAGLTGKDAAQFMAENSNIIARNGGRFADSLTRAAIEAKKAGYSLQSIEGFGDRIVGDFEGFLEDATAMAAMGMQFDVSSLAEAAVTGDTERLKNELQSQLQAQGLSLENMNRAQRMQLERTIGMPLEEALKIQKAEDTAVSASSQMDYEAAQMQSDAANILRVMAAVFEGAVKLFGIAVALDVATRKIFGKGLFDVSKRFTGELAARISNSVPGTFVRRMAQTVARSGVGRVVGSAAGMVGRGVGAVARGVGKLGTRFGPALGLGIVGTGLNVAGEKLKEQGYEKTGALADIAGKAASFAGLGALFGPVGAAIGALVGTIYGVITNWEAVKKMVSDSVTMLVSGIKWLGGKLLDIGKWLWENNPVIQAFRWMADKIKNFKLSDLWSSSKVDAAQPTQSQLNEPGTLSRMGSAVSGFFANRSNNVATSTVTPASNRNTAQMNADSQTVATNTNRPPTINLPDNATLQQQIAELIRLNAVANQKLDALANQNITVNMDGQKVGNIIKRSSMAASTGASTARLNG